jgi:hypothetical protein
MNMPTHIIAKPTDVEADATTGVLRSGAFGKARSGQGDRLGTDADEEQDRIGCGEDERDLGQTQAKRQGGDFSDDD